MKKSEELKNAASEEDNNLKALGLMTKSLREGRLERFQEKVLPQLLEKGYDIAYDEQNVRYTIDTAASGKSIGIVDFYPKGNKVCIRKTNKWINIGLTWIIERLLNT